MKFNSIVNHVLFLALFSTICLVVQNASALPVPQDKETVPEKAHPTEVDPGDTALLETEKGMHYFLRVPKSYDEEDGARLVIFMHGSNMNGLAYLRSFEARNWADDDIIVCPNGEKGDDPYGGNNFTFSSANYVSDLTEQILDAFNVTRVYIGGHSQGGFVTYSVIMHFPDLYQGAFPMAGDCWMQNEPNLWQDQPEKMAKQKEIPIAVIHGQQDPVVSFSQGQHAYDVFATMGYPKLKFYNPKNLGHQFMLSPVDDALDWLDAMNGVDPTSSIKLAEKWIKDRDYQSAFQAAREIIESSESDDSVKARAEKIVEQVETAAQEATSEIKPKLYEPAIQWLADWTEYRQKFGATDTAKQLVGFFDDARAEQWEQGRKMFFEARGLFQQDKDDEAYELLEKLLEETPNSYYAYYAAKWIKSRDEKEDDK